MACGLRRCSGKRGCICPRVSSTSYRASCPAVLLPPSSVEAREGEAVPEDVVKLFQYFDRNCNGKLDRDELTEVLQSLDKKFWTTSRISKMFRAADLDRDHFISWPEFLTWVFAKGKEQQAVRVSLPKLEAAFEEKQRADRLAKSEHESSLVAAWANRSAGDMAAALERAKLSGIFTPDELQEFKGNLETLRVPFEVSVSTLSGLTCTVEVTREQTVASLCEEVSKQVGVKAYRIHLAHEKGCLQPPSAKLEECGVKGNMELGARFGEVDASLELEGLEFLFALLTCNLVTETEFIELRQQYHDGKLEEDTCRNKYGTSLKHRLEAEEKMQEEQRAATKRRDARYAKHRARFEALTFDALVAEATEAGLIREGAAVPQLGESNELCDLIEHLSLTTAIEACEAESPGLASAYENKKAQVAEMNSDVQMMQYDYRCNMAAALPALDAAVAALKQLAKSDVQKVRAMRNPPVAVRVITEAVCIMFQIKPILKSGIYDYWEPAQRHLLSDPTKLISDLFEYDKENIPDTVIQQIEPYMTLEDFDPDALAKASRAAATFCRWVRAMHTYYRVAKFLEPAKQVMLKEEALIKPVMDELLECQVKLSQILDDTKFFKEKLEELRLSRNATISI